MTRSRDRQNERIKITRMKFFTYRGGQGTQICELTVRSGYRGAVVLNSFASQLQFHIVPASVRVTVM